MKPLLLYILLLIVVYGVKNEGFLETILCVNLKTKMARVNSV